MSTPPPTHRKSAALTAGTKKRMLLVEGEWAVCDDYKTSLSRLYPNVTIDVAGNLLQAIDLLKAHTYSAIMINEKFPFIPKPNNQEVFLQKKQQILSDLGAEDLPEVNGIALLKAIRQSSNLSHNKTTPVYYQGYGLPEERISEAHQLNATCNEKGMKIPSSEEQAFLRANLDQQRRIG